MKPGTKTIGDWHVTITGDGTMVIEGQSGVVVLKADEAQSIVEFYEQQSKAE